jgi:hypothetical protein
MISHSTKLPAARAVNPAHAPERATSRVARREVRVAAELGHGRGAVHARLCCVLVSERLAVYQERLDRAEQPFGAA